MKIGSTLAFILMLPALALFGGIGILAWHISTTWDQRHTDQVITGLITTCGLFVVGLAVLGAFGMWLLMNLAKMRRQNEEWAAGRTPEQWNALPGPQRPPSWAGGPPQLTDGSDKIGSFDAMPNSFDTWDDSAIDGEWR